MIDFAQAGFYFLSSHLVHPPWFFMGSGDFSHGASSGLNIKLIEIKNVWSITSTSLVHLHNVYFHMWDDFISMH
jgi:hypothetical protein